MDGVETHDCFTTTEYTAIDHLGLTPPGESWKPWKMEPSRPAGAASST
jgi:acetyl-CoA C-acetyltransferase